MTCPSLSRPVAVADLFGDLAARVRSDDGVGQFSRFVLVGGFSSAVYGLLFVLLRGLGEVPANLVGAALSSVLANELHRRLTFRAGERVGWFAAQWEGGALALAGMVATSLALSWFNSSVHEPAVAAEVLVIAAVTATIGTLRFLALRWVFRPRPV
ncbi:Putative flippase GtrA (transmembrane translocase of bactoprenol-linked glucose) [Geodermatophilus dictyosporus]|uniref:Putative flippase GtrA (Transmembrane translocase of bactoprenol-linked glucose) n=1 Tax=Geodermatophilus dictyosporus TaxID=1523247 RepID=A0A1I5UVT0_9ACTN|nr:GtrA family protein [Geodermatophilus dictyosporus]SFP99361.1 Putative flippase GtrA (transmembrane translocase of bactoprenol-linked glucose) [Geodermatophilus dictyosporus]